MNQDPQWLQKLRKVHPYKLYLWIAIVGIGIMFFFIECGFVLSNKSSANYLPGYFTFSTFLMLLSSYLMYLALKYYREDQIAPLHHVLMLCLIIGQIFIYSQLKGWRELALNGYFFNGIASSSYLYLLSGLHLVHFLGGIIYLFVVYLAVYRAFRDPVKNLIYHTDPYEYMKLQVLVTYWHFMDILWLIMYLVFFLFSK